MPVPTQGTDLYKKSIEDLKNDAVTCSDMIQKLLVNEAVFAQLINIVRDYYNGLTASAEINFVQICTNAGIRADIIPSLKQAVFGGDLGVNW